MISWMDGEDLTPELRLALIAVRQALGGRPLNPALLEKTCSTYRDAVPSHKVSIEHIPRSAKGERPRLKTRYTIVITGDRVDGRWHFSPGQLAEVLDLLDGLHERDQPDDEQATGREVDVVAKPSFRQIAVAAFPRSCSGFADAAATALVPYIDEGYRLSQFRSAIVLGKIVRIPSRIHFRGLDESKLSVAAGSWPALHCLCTRGTDGYLRQASVRRVLSVNEPWVVPFIALLASEYVVEIVSDIAAAIPALNRDMYANFVRENRPLMRLLWARATSYWDCYHRAAYPDRNVYPGLAFLREVEIWAS